MSSVCFFGWWQVLEEYLKWRWGTMPSNLGACPSGAGSVAAMRLVLMAQGDSNDILRQFRPVRDCTVSCFAPKKRMEQQSLVFGRVLLFVPSHRLLPKSDANILSKETSREPIKTTDASQVFQENVAHSGLKKVASCSK